MTLLYCLYIVVLLPFTGCSSTRDVLLMIRCEAKLFSIWRFLCFEDRWTPSLLILSPSCPKKLVSHRKVDSSFKCRRRTAESWPEELDLLCVLMLQCFCKHQLTRLLPGRPIFWTIPCPWTLWYHGQRPNVKRFLGDCVSFQQLPRKHLIASCPITSDPSATWPLLKRPYLPYSSLYAGIKTNSN